VELDQEKRVMLAFALSIVMLVLYRIYFVKEPPPETKKATPAATATASPGAPSAAKAAPATVPVPAPAPAPLAAVQGAKAEEFVVEGKLYRVTFSTVGAVARSWVIKGYPKGELTETVNAAACDKLGYPLSKVLPDAALQAQIKQ